MIDAGIGANEAVACFSDEHVVAANEPTRFPEDYFHETGVFPLALRDGLCLRRRLDGRQPDRCAFSLRNNLLRDDQDVAVFETYACFAGSIRYLLGQIVATLNLRQSGQAKQAYTRMDNGGMLRR